MAVQETALKSSVSMKLDVGRNEDEVLTVSTPLPGVATTADNEKIMTVVMALAPCFESSLYTTQRTNVVQLTMTQ